MALLSAEIEPPGPEGFRPVHLHTDRGPVEARYYPVADATRAAVWVGGVGGGFDTPARGLYPRLAADLTADGIASLRVRFRNPRSLEEAVPDLRAALAFLASEGVRDVALIGHSFGGAVVIRTAAVEPALVRTVIALATQSFGVEPVHDLAGPVLLIHGEADEVLKPLCSIQVHRMARDPKKLVLMPGSGHCLDETAEAVCHEVRDWIKAHLPGT